jgi:protein TonB
MGIGAKATERLLLAVLASFALHLALAVLIQGEPPGAGVQAGTPLLAWLEQPVKQADDKPAPNEPEQAQAAPDSEPAPVPAEPRKPVLAESAPAAQAPAQPKPEPASPVAREAVPSAFDVPVLRDPTYYAARFLDEYPRPLSPVDPRYPDRAVRDDISGKVTLLLLIDESGALREVSVVEAVPAGIFDEAALAAFRGMRFAPARKDGRAVRSRVLITVGFESGKAAQAQ